MAKRLGGHHNEGGSFASVDLQAAVELLGQHADKLKTERVGKDMIRPLLSLERLSLDEQEAQICYRYGKQPREVE